MRPTRDPITVVVRQILALGSAAGLGGKSVVVGSRVGRTRHCATRQQWVEYDIEQQRQARETLRQGTQPVCMTPGERAAIAGRYLPASVGGTCQ